ncbi:GrpB family protein [Acinetobacter sp. S40]|uniref:GrpB family protein n=1 Tax=Acinetobacter sp. S40 TaxID=2767434 RepID=UPI00190C473C|nr:GrpB family protein [Acinetobacter sp. S40]MBJ9985170.1 GrpB family protein [Acinetobacter sp. S40]
MKFYQAQDYQPECQNQFQYYQALIHEKLPFARIEHIGSSSIVNTVSKGDLDIYIEVSPECFNHALDILKPLGFMEKQNTLRTDELCMLIATDQKLDIALQVVTTGSVFEFFLTFRDRLNANPVLVRQYNHLKERCTGLDEDIYRQYKSAFIEHVLQSY